MRATRAVATRAATEQISTIDTSTRAPAQACRCQSSYGEMAYVKTCTVIEEIGCVNDVEKNRLLNDVNSSGAVSPATRASASTTPVMIPGNAAGTITVNTARARVAPSASAPSRSASGTRSSSSSVVLVMIGIIMTPSAKPPASVLKCRSGSTTTAYANTPMTIDGTPFRVSAANLTADAKRLPRYSDRYTP